MPTFYGQARSRFLQDTRFNLRQVCHMQDGEILGNLNERGLAEICDSRSAKERQAQALTCNRCWLNCQRIADVELFEYFEERYPHAELVEHFGPYSWPLPRAGDGRALTP
jgi:hypothetical protein